MQDGRTVRTGMLVRSGCLAKATDSDVAVLKEKYRLSDVFDFRFEAEVNAAPDRIIDGVSYTHLSTLPKAQTMARQLYPAIVTDSLARCLIISRTSWASRKRNNSNSERNTQ